MRVLEAWIIFRLIQGISAILSLLSILSSNQWNYIPNFQHEKMEQQYIGKPLWIGLRFRNLFDRTSGPTL